MKIAVRQLTHEPRSFREDVPAGSLDLETEIIKFREPIRVEIQVWRITNVVSVEMSLSGALYVPCGRCLEEVKIGLDRHLQLNYPVSPSDQTLDLGPDIREELILGYPLTPLCNTGCKGLCARCGKNLNEGGCSCATT